MTDLDRSHDPARTSWVTSANGHRDFPIQNLPFGVIEGAGEEPEVVVAIGDMVLHLRSAVEAGWGSELSIDAITRIVFGPLNHLAAASPREWTLVRLALSDALSDPAWQERLTPALMPQDEVEMLLPLTIGDYTDFYASVHHATNVGSMFRPDNPLLPNYKWVPIGYHGRASSIVLDGTPIHRPSGQTKGPDADAPSFGPSRSLDYELEVALVIGGENDLGTPVTAATAADRIFGVVLLNDWSARDLQAWEYQPLGPFLAKNFASTISPWVVTTDALKPFRAAMPARPDCRSCAAALPAGPGRPHLAHRARRGASHRSDAGARRFAVRRLARRLRRRHVLESGAAGDAPRQQRLQPAPRRSPRQRDDLRSRAGESRLPPRADLARRRAAHAPRRNVAQVPRRRR
ncbi:MAG: fumarylacetoacetate hydrolase family protein [Gemmatimonadales bacterium]